MGCHGVSAAKDQRGLLAQDAAVDSQLDVGIEHGEERLEVAIARGSEERVDQLPLSHEIRIGLGEPRTSPRAAGKLLRGCFGAVEDRGDLRESHAEHVVQHEREPLRRTQRIEHHQQREADGVGDQRLLLGATVSARLTTGSGT